jgi:hypothetical protein
VCNFYSFQFILSGLTPWLLCNLIYIYIYIFYTDVVSSLFVYLCVYEWLTFNSHIHLLLHHIILYNIFVTHCLVIYMLPIFLSIPFITRSPDVHIFLFLSRFPEHKKISAVPFVLSPTLLRAIFPYWTCRCIGVSPDNWECHLRGWFQTNITLCLLHLCFLYLLYWILSQIQIKFYYHKFRPPLWSSDQSSWLQIQRSRVRLLVLPDFLSSGSGTGSTQPREYNWGATWKN